jgi:hypothetical protein
VVGEVPEPEPPEVSVVGEVPAPEPPEVSVVADVLAEVPPPEPPDVLVVLAEDGPALGVLEVQAFAALGLDELEGGMLGAGAGLEDVTGIL